jgi:hypothetical protein
MSQIDRRDFLKQTSTALAVGVVGPAVTSFPAPAIQTGRVRPVVIADFSGFNYRNGGN